MDGAVGCVPLCPSHVPLASPSCPAPRLVKVPGQCCLSVDCHRRPGPPAYGPYPPTAKKQKAALGNELLEVGRKWDRQHLAGKSGRRPFPARRRVHPHTNGPSVRLVFRWLPSHQRLSLTAHTSGARE